MKKFICETKNLSKKYKDFYALKNVNLTIPKGEIYGLVGEKGFLSKNWKNCCRRKWGRKNNFNPIINGT